MRTKTAVLFTKNIFMVQIETKLIQQSDTKATDVFKLSFVDLSRLCSNSARSPEATNIRFRASEKNYPVARPGTLAYCISSR